MQCSWGLPALSAKTHPAGASLFVHRFSYFNKHDTTSRDAGAAGSLGNAFIQQQAPREILCGHCAQVASLSLWSTYVLCSSKEDMQQSWLHVLWAYASTAAFLAHLQACRPPPPPPSLPLPPPAADVEL